MKRRSLDKLYKQLMELEANIEVFDYQMDSVSSASIGWHVEHSLLVLNGIIDSIKVSDPSKFKWKFNFSKLYIFAIGRFPRGKGRAPKSVIPKEQIDQSNLSVQLKLSMKNVGLLSTLDEGMFFKHPLFGNLKLRKSIYFLELHAEHHLKIIREIVSGR